MTKTEQQKTLKAMQEQLGWRRGDVTTISAMADLSEDLGEPEEKIDALRRAAKSAEQVEESRKMMEDLEEAHKQRIETYYLKLVAARKSCPHPVTKYYPDASGNNDDSTVCMCCGANL